MVLGNKMREEKNSPEEKIIFQPRQETTTVEGYERLATLCVKMRPHLQRDPALGNQVEPSQSLQADRWAEKHLKQDVVGKMKK